MYPAVAARRKPAPVLCALTALGLLLGAGAGFADGAARVNALRQLAGLGALAPQAQLTEAARRHAEYLDTNIGEALPRHGVSVHRQLGYRPSYSGSTPKERALNAGYPHDRVIENVTLGYRDAGDSVDGLMAAIYHRLAFLDFTIDELGVSGKGRTHVFLMGRSDIRALCREPAPEARIQPPVDCLGTRVTQGYLRRLCDQMPAEARFRPPWPESCPNGVRLDAGFMAGFCSRPPAAALELRGERYYEMCNGRWPVGAGWLDELCAAPPEVAAYPYSGAYYEICEPRVAVHSEWLQLVCAAAGGEDLYRDSGRYQRLCAERPVDVRSEYLAELRLARYRAAPRYVVWPPDRSAEVPPAFFEEEPDPLPDREVSGYPVSIQFNPAWAQEIRLRDFALFENLDGEWRRLNNTRLMSAASDPHRKLDEQEFALFPLDRLRWDREYLAVMLAEVNGGTEHIEWSFTTRRPAERLVELGASDQTLVLASDKDTALYLPPTPTRPRTVTALRSRYNSTSDLRVWGIDANTLGVRIGGSGCRPVYLELKEGPELRLLREGCTGVSRIETAGP